MMLTSEAEEAWWPPTLSPSSPFRDRFAWSTMRVASHSTRRSAAASASRSAGAAARALLVSAGSPTASRV